ncbi:MAG: hypothetical protein ACI89X_002087 [Planctomycetota bacterium]|jgi:hypothetical protein
MNIRYTLKEANQVLKLVRVISDEMLERRTDRRQLARRREQLEAAQTPEGLRSELSELDARIWEHDEALYNCKHELEVLGLTVLRTNPLTVHIPGLSVPATSRKRARARATPTSPPNQEVVFCWQEGEDDVGFGHPLGEEEHQRRPLRVAKGA